MVLTDAQKVDILTQLQAAKGKTITGPTSLKIWWEKNWRSSGLSMQQLRLIAEGAGVTLWGQN